MQQGCGQRGPKLDPGRGRLMTTKSDSKTATRRKFLMAAGATAAAAP